MNGSKNIKKQLEWTPEALQSRKDTYYKIAYVDFAPMNANLVDARIIQTADRLTSFPESGKPFKHGLRLAFVTKTQYTIVYKITETTVRILRVSHQKKKTP